jgi:hypothetical protein
MRAFAAWLMRSLWTAVAAAAVFGILGLKFPPFAVLSAAVAGLLALRSGWQAGLLVAVLAAIPVGAAWVWLGSKPGLVFPLVFALWPPVLAAAQVLRRTESQGLALLVVGLTVAGYALAMHLATGDVVAFWQAWLRRAVAAVPGATVQGFEAENTLRLINGFLGLMYGLCQMLALLLARWLQSLLYNPGGFGAEFRRLRLPRAVLPVAVALVWAVGFLNPILQADWFIAAMLVFFFAGLAAVHGIIAVRGLSLGWTVPIYLGLVYMPFILIPGLALLGAVDAFVDFRTRKPGRDDNE